MEIINESIGLLKCDMGKKPKARPPRLFVPQWIDALGYKRKDVAKAVDIDISYINNLGRDSGKSPSSLVLLAIAKEIGCSSQDFYRAPPDEKALETLAGFSPDAIARLLNPSTKR